MIIVLYVDDIVIAATRKDDIDQFVHLLSKRFKITQRPLEYILGIRVSDTRADNGRISCSIVTQIISLDVPRPLRSLMVLYSLRLCALRMRKSARRCVLSLTCDRQARHW